MGQEITPLSRTHTDWQLRIDSRSGLNLTLGSRVLQLMSHIVDKESGLSYI